MQHWTTSQQPPPRRATVALQDEEKRRNSQLAEVLYMASSIPWPPGCLGLPRAGKLVPRRRGKKEKIDPVSKVSR